MFKDVVTLMETPILCRGTGFLQGLGISVAGNLYYYYVSWKKGNVLRTISGVVAMDNEKLLADRLRVFEETRRAEGYVTLETDLVPPMIVGKYKPGKVKFPCLAQPKLAGMRCLSDGERFWGDKGIRLGDDLVSHLKYDINDIILDGELMEDGSYHVFDCVSDEPYMSRHGRVASLLMCVKPKLVFLVKDVVCSSSEDVDRFLRKALKFGYSGLILRASDGMYVAGKRSKEVVSCM